MAEEKKRYSRGVIVEFDFTAVDGAQLLFDTAKKVLKGHGVALTLKQECKYLAGGNYQGALKELFEATGSDADPVAVAQELGDAFKAALTAKAVAAVTPEFLGFVKELTERNIKVVVATRSDVEQLRALFADLNHDLVTVYAEPSNTYGNCKWDAWRRACNQNGLVDVLTAAVAGSGKGVKSALVAGLAALAVVHDHVRYQDFGGADDVVEAFDPAMADTVCRMLHLR